MRTYNLFVLVDPWQDSDVSPPDLLRFITAWLNELRGDAYALDSLRMSVVVHADPTAKVTPLSSITEIQWIEPNNTSNVAGDISVALDEMTETYLKTVTSRLQDDSSIDFLLFLTEGRVRDPLHVSTQLRVLRDLGMSRIICATSRAGSNSPALKSSSNLVSFVKDVDAKLIISELTWHIEAPISY